ncbi:hypothetical protein DH2020_027375 [Rehmannia glutinosa]|uniref:Uncharacterized protein n=1 Tax=Rehmannia glutinosa TaxID=99300 RepID=A0ABR0VUD7_REHGL
MQVLAPVKGCGLLGYLTGAISAPTQFIVNTETNETKINPEFESFTKQDQLLASWMLSSLSESVLILVVGLDSSADIWRCLETNFSSQSKARMMQYKLQLQTLKKGTLSMREYLGKAKAACDALASAGQKLSEEDQLLHILSGLPSEYNPVIVTITSAIDLYSLSEACALLLSFESRLDFVSKNNSSLNSESFTANVAQSQQRRNTTFPHNNRGRGTPFQRDSHTHSPVSNTTNNFTPSLPPLLTKVINSSSSINSPPTASPLPPHSPASNPHVSATSPISSSTSEIEN